MRTVLFINSSHKPSEVLIGLFKELESYDFDFIVFASGRSICQKFSNQKNKRLHKKIRTGPETKGNFSALLFLLSWPFLCLRYFIPLFIASRRRKISSVICVGKKDKLIFTPIARLLGLKVIWMEKPNTSYKCKLELKMLLLIRKKVKILVFLRHTERFLIDSGFERKMISNIGIGVKEKNKEKQDTIFSKIAEETYSAEQDKYFTMGAFLDRHKIRSLEMLFDMLGTCYNTCYHIRAVFIANKEERKKIAWMARQHGVGEIVYLVGREEDMDKWHRRFDVYLSVGDDHKLADLTDVLGMMGAGMPVITLKGSIFEEIVDDGVNGFILDGKDFSQMAEKIIQLQSDKKLKKKLGANAKEKTLKEYSFEGHLNNLIKNIK